MNAIAKQEDHEGRQKPGEVVSSHLDLLDDDALLENIVDIINENFVLEVAASNPRVERALSVG